VLIGCHGDGRARAPRPTRPDPTTTALIERAEAAERARRYDRAEALYRRAKDQAPDAPSRAVATRALARALIFWGEYRRGAAELEHAAALDPGDAGTWHDLGMVRHHQGDVAGAELALGRAVALAPADARPRIALAALLWKHGRYADALRQYRALQALELPETLRAKVDWAVRSLRRRLEAGPESAR
jgi:tetratricopeptide (TPR) repeat protein